MINETDIEAFREPSVERRCKDCAYFLPDKNLFNLWGLIKDGTYYNFAKCQILPVGTTEALYCTIHRSSKLADFTLCGPKGKYWKKNEVPY